MGRVSPTVKEGSDAQPLSILKSNRCGYTLNPAKKSVGSLEAEKAGKSGVRLAILRSLVSSSNCAAFGRLARRARGQPFYGW